MFLRSKDQKIAAFGSSYVFVVFPRRRFRRWLLSSQRTHPHPIQYGLWVDAADDASDVALVVELISVEIYLLSLYVIRFHG